jgi:V/A-type H+-transporting ATPase subunit C
LAKLKDTDFLYISTHLRSLENRLLSRERMERMLEARTDEDAARVLSECGYTGLEKLSSESLSRSLSQARAETFSELASFSPNRDIVDVFRIKYDYHNAKALIKCAHSGRSAQNMLMDAGRYTPEEMTAAVLQSETGSLSSALSRAIEAASEVLSTTGDPQRADFLLDSACYQEMLATAKSSGSSFLQSYVRLQIDAANLKSAVRGLRMKKSVDFLKKVLLSGGNVSVESISGVYTTGGNLETVFSGRLQEAAVLGDEAVKGGRQTAFEKACDNALNTYLQESRMVPFGDSVLIAFAAAKENEITAARIIMSGRMAGVSTEAIRERLRDAYV